MARGRAVAKGWKQPRQEFTPGKPWLTLHKRLHAVGRDESIQVDTELHEACTEFHREGICVLRKARPAVHLSRPAGEVVARSAAGEGAGSSSHPKCAPKPRVQLIAIARIGHLLGVIQLREAPCGLGATPCPLGRLRSPQAGRPAAWESAHRNAVPAHACTTRKLEATE